MNLDTKVTLLDANPIRMLGEGDRKFSDYIAGVYQRDYYQPFELADEPLYQFLSNYENHEAFLIEYGEEILEYTVSLLQSHRNKTFNSECFFGSIDGKLFVYFDDGILAPATVKAGDSVSCIIPSYGTLTGYVISESYKSEVKSEGYLLDIDLNIPVGVAGEITINYDLKDQDSFGFTFDFPKEGYFQIKLRAWTGLVQDIFISEPLEVFIVHEDTIEIEVNDPLFDLDLVYPYNLKYRFKGNCYIPKTAGEIETYTDDNGTELNYKAVPQYSKVLRGSEIPGWQIHMFNQILSHREIIFEGKKYNVESFGEVENIQWNDLNEYEVTLKLIDDPARREKKKTVVIGAVFNPSSLSFIADGEVKEALIVSDLNDFVLVSKPAFISVSLVNKTLTLTASENSAFTGRSGSVIYRSVKFPLITLSVEVVQAAQVPSETDYLEVSPLSLEFAYNDLNWRDINISASGVYNISGLFPAFDVAIESDTLIRVKPKVNNTGNDIILGQIILTLGAIEKQINLTQYTIGNIISISPTSYNGGGQSTFNINVTAESNCQWAVTKDRSWITVFKISGTGNDTIGVSLQSNSGIQSRSGSITVYNANNPNNYFVFNITQTGTGTIIQDPIQP